MYLSAIPTIAVEWGVSESVISLSLVLWFVAFSIFLLVWGPISDRWGTPPGSDYRSSRIRCGKLSVLDLQHASPTDWFSDPPGHRGSGAFDNGHGNLQRPVRRRHATEGSSASSVS